MTDDTTHDGEIRTEAELRDAIGEVLERATRNGLSPAGTFSFRIENDDPDWEVLIVELESKGAGD